MYPTPGWLVWVTNKTTEWWWLEAQSCSLVSSSVQEPWSPPWSISQQGREGDGQRSFSAMLEFLNRLCTQPGTWVKNCLKLMRHVAVWPWIIQYSKFHLLPLQGWLKSMYLPNRHTRDRLVTVSSGVLSSLSWWTDLLQVSGEVPFLVPLPTKTESAFEAKEECRAVFVDFFSYGSWRSMTQQ